MIDWLGRHWTRPAAILPATENFSGVEDDSGPMPEQVYNDAARHYLDVQISSFDVLD